MPDPLAASDHPLALGGVGAVPSLAPKEPLFTAGDPKGLQKAGNLDILARPQVANPDGSISTVRSITVDVEGGVMVLPTVIGDRIVSIPEAIEHFRRTGEHLGIFDTEENANAYSQSLHEQQEQYYRR